jgi:hypothetical protein
VVEGNFLGIGHTYKGGLDHLLGWYGEPLRRSDGVRDQSDTSLYISGGVRQRIQGGSERIRRGSGPHRRGSEPGRRAVGRIRRGYATYLGWFGTYPEGFGTGSEGLCNVSDGVQNRIGGVRSWSDASLDVSGVIMQRI